MDATPQIARDGWLASLRRRLVASRPPLAPPPWHDTQPGVMQLAAPSGVRHSVSAVSSAARTATTAWPMPASSA
jgi:hypothetical protein